MSYKKIKIKPEYRPKGDYVPIRIQTPDLDFDRLEKWKSEFIPEIQKDEEPLPNVSTKLIQKNKTYFKESIS